MHSFKDRGGELLRRLVEQSSEHAFVLIDPQGRITDWSAGAVQLFGYSAEEAIGRPIATIFTSDDQARGISDLEMTIAAQDATSQDDRWQRRADGSKFWATGAMTALRDDAGELLGYCKVLRDRTDLREQLDQLLQRLTAAREADRQKEVALATVSHELRNLLGALAHVLQQLSAPQGDAQRRETLSALMREQVTLLGRLIEDLLEAQQLKSHKVRLNPEAVSLQDLLSRVIAAAQPQLVSKDVQLQLLAPASAIVVNGEGSRLHQVFANLLDNAIKYTPPAGRIWIKATIEDPDAVVHIEDTGVGIPPDMLSHVFELFTQVDSGVSRKGLGIGLAVVRELVELHGGSVQARSEGLGKGSEFTVRLPLAS